MPISFRHLLLPEKFPLGTELLDLRPLTIICLQDNAPDAMIMYQRSGIMELNSIQTQVFSSFFKSNDNIFLGAPSGSGKTLCAELAIIKVLEEYSNGHCVYVSPIESMAKQRAEDWKKRFRDELSYEVNLLTGDSAADLRLLNNSHVIITNPVNWDKMSRPWRRKNRQVVREINLFIVDDIHLIGGNQGSTLEMIVSRMRYMENQTGNKMRFIALSTTVANYNNLADWIGATNRGRFNFPLSNRQISLDMHVSGSDINSYEDRQIAFLKPAYSYINRYSENDPIIIFAPNRKYTRTISSDLVALTANEENSFRFLHLDRKLFEPHIKKFKSESLKTCLKHGIAYIHKFTNEDVKKQLKIIFQSDATQILVIEKSLAWNLDINIKSNMVIVLGTSYFDGIVHSFEDYKISDITKMIGYAQRPGIQREVCTSVVFTHTSKIDFYKKFLQDPFPVESHLVSDQRVQKNEKRDVYS
jgi:pre-mRNA-splicing helicase BRR2